MKSRERTLLLVTLGALGLLLLDQVVLRPWLERWDAVEESIIKKQQELSEAERLLLRESRVNREWEALRERLEAQDRAITTEGLLMHVDTLGQAAGVSRNIMNTKPGREMQTGDFKEISLELSLETDIEGLRNLLTELHNSSEFLKVSKLAVSSQLDQRRREYRLDVDLRISTVRFEPVKPKNGRSER